MAKLGLKVSGKTDPGRLREENEDTFAVDTELGLFAVLDGMGGHAGGDVASSMARDVVVETVRSRLRGGAPASLLVDAIADAGRSVFAEASRRRSHHGMGTTVVAMLMDGDHRAVIAHVGDSRAYLHRDGHFRQITADHTVVSELLRSGAITPEEALHHPYKNVLSRSLGYRDTVQIDVADLDLRPGDRILLCSDGLSSYASQDAIAKVLGGAEDPDSAASDLIELAHRGGGGDNITCVVAFAGKAVVPQSTQILRTVGADAWWRRRELFMAEAKKLQVSASPICAHLPAEDALNIIAGTLCEAIFHDLEQMSGLNVWTFSENLATGWINRNDDFGAFFDLLDQLRACAQAVLVDVGKASEAYAVTVEVAVYRALVVAEMAAAGVIAERLRNLESQMRITHEETFRPRENTEQPTVPFLGGPRLAPPNDEVQHCLTMSYQQAAAHLPSTDLASVCLKRMHELSMGSFGGSDVLSLARELYDEDNGTMPLFEALEQARHAQLQNLKELDEEVEVRASAMSRLATAYQSVANGVGVLVVDAGRPITDSLKEMAEHTGVLRNRVRRLEEKLTKLEAEVSAVTVLDATIPEES